MSAPVVTVNFDLTDGSGNYPATGSASVVPNAQVSDTTDGFTLIESPVTTQFNGTLKSLALYATDNSNMAPSGWAWTLSFSNVPATGMTFFAPAGPCSFTASHASPAVFTWSSPAAFTAAFPTSILPNGTVITLAGSPPAGFTAGTPYYVVSSVATAFSLAASKGGSAIASTATGSGTFTVTQYDYSGLVPQSPPLAGSVTPSGAISLRSYVNPNLATQSSAVQNWLNAVAAATGLGAEGYADPGTYLIDVTPSLNSATGIRLRGAGTATLFKAYQNSQPNLLQFTNCSKVSISDIAFDGNRVNVTQLSTQYLTLAGVWMQNCTDTTIRNCHVDNCYSSGLMFNGGCVGIDISGCRLTNCGDNQIYVRAQNTTPYTPCQNITVRGCNASGGSYSGIQGLASVNFTVVDCVAYANGPTQAQGDGIGSEGCTDFTFTGNVCFQNGVQGIQARFTNEIGTTQQSTNGVISGNVVWGHTSSNGDAGGIGINDTDTIEVSGNVVTGNYYGINVNGGDGLGVSHLRIIGNTVRSNTNAGLRMVPGSGSDYKVSNLYCADNGADNVYCQAVTTFTGGHFLRATGNHEGIHFASGSGGSVVKGAEISGNTDNGVLIDAGVGPIDLRDVWFDGSGTDQLRAVQEQSTGGPTTMVNCKIRNQKNNLYTFNNAASRFQTADRAVPVNYKPSPSAGTSSTTLVMMGVGGTCVYTPLSTGLVQVTVTAYGNVSTGTVGISCGCRYGTGTAPANGAAVTGTRFGATSDPGARPSGTGAGAGTAFAFNDILTLTPGTAYWFDLALATTNASDAAALSAVSISITELP